MERFQLKGAPTCRVVYPKGLFTKTLVKGAEDKPENYKYNAIILIPKDDEGKMAQMNNAYAEACQALQGKMPKVKIPAAINPKNNCWEDGDDYADKNEGAEAFRGYMRLKVASKQVRPIVVDMERKRITNGYAIANLDVEDTSTLTLNDGDYVIPNVSFWVYDKGAGIFGIGANIHFLARHSDGERIGGASENPDDYIDFSEYEA